MTHDDVAMARLPDRIRQGLEHRLLFASFCLVPMAGFAWVAWRDGGLIYWLPCAGCLLGAVLAFLSPTILTQGWNQPFPPAAHLDLLGRRRQRILGCIASALVLSPFVATSLLRWL